MTMEIRMGSGLIVVLDSKDACIQVGPRTIGTAPWCAKTSAKSKTVYAKTSALGRIMLMHRIIMGVTDPKVQVDHIDGDGLNNRRVNLRIVTHSQNQRNLRLRTAGTSRFVGVFWHKQSGKWAAKVKVSGATKHIGLFGNEADAARAYDRTVVVIDRDWLTNEKAGRFDL